VSNSALLNIEDFRSSVVRGAQIVDGRHVSGAMTVECPYCGALKFNGETTGMCCRNGKVQLAELAEPPQPLKEYLSNAQFLQNIRRYNNVHAFTSMGAKVDEQLANARDGVYTFRIQGQMHHSIGSMQAVEGEAPKFSQIYFWDEAEQVSRRQEIFPCLDQAKVEGLTRMMHALNPYVHAYRQAHEEPTENFGIKFLSTPALDMRTYNTPTAPEIAVLMVEDGNESSGRDLLVKKRGRGLFRISETHPCYDPMQYPLLFPRGEGGWHPGILHRDGVGRVTVKDWGCYYSQIRNVNKLTNILHLSGRLFQQWIVDQYAKVEQERLQYIRHNQRKIRAELYQGLMDADGARVGTRIVLPSTFMNGPRYVFQLHLPNFYPCAADNCLH
jgi:hypothetical protein